MHILIIEDNLDIVANLAAYLEPLDYKLDVAHNGTIGLRRALAKHHDAILLDLSLPDLDGLEVCQRLRSEHRIATPVLMLTARDMDADIAAGFNVGANDYLVKPYSLFELEARLKALVQRHPS
ncbi:response regulator transcription factor [Noviherbaspirillum sp. CPCC 100848]|uniref:Response regulator transcription factor n=1 Tax=Noviherbaspirillum album TaxID=3080276 RepID=A0ABU6JFM1_9BURK|nr:response regulator transcription factor [Noviherbaspirillum sp. CPCC 100848]MEC4722208.1 response regulator transcription factor [Noviherbaspirillum sp. CPCC 100848]